jgi:hypothetical protein
MEEQFAIPELFPEDAGRFGLTQSVAWLQRKPLRQVLDQVNWKNTTRFQNQPHATRPQLTSGGHSLRGFLLQVNWQNRRKA